MASSLTTDVKARMTATEALARLEALDLSMIRLKLADPEEGKGWDAAQLQLAEREYRRFLALHLMYPDEAIVPCGFVDEVWHAHILDTQAYGPDCDKVFGFFLHHFPYFGLRGSDDAADLVHAYEATLGYYSSAFGVQADDAWRGMTAKNCRTQCKPQKCS